MKMAKQSDKFCTVHTWDNPDHAICTVCGYEPSMGASNGKKQLKKEVAEYLQKEKEKTQNNENGFSDNLQKVMKNQEPIWKNAGRKKKKTPQTLKKILEMVSVGYPIDVSCSRNYVTYDTFNRWCREDKELRRALDSALSSCEAIWVTPIIEGAAAGNQEDAEWLLRHRIPHKYSTRIESVTHSPDEYLADPTGELIAFITGAKKPDSE